MTFNESNSAEHYIIHKLSGVNLNTNTSEDNLESYKWLYKDPVQINRGINDVLVEGEIKEALIRLNPEINQKPELADEIIYKLRGE